MSYLSVKMDNFFISTHRWFHPHRNNRQPPQGMPGKTTRAVWRCKTARSATLYGSFGSAEQAVWPTAWASATCKPGRSHALAGPAATPLGAKPREQKAGRAHHCERPAHFFKKKSDLKCMYNNTLIPQHFDLTLFISSWATKSCSGFCHVRNFTYLSVVK